MIFGLPIWQYVLSQVFGAIMLGITIWALQTKNKAKTLLIYTLANVFAIASNALLLNFVIVATKSVSIFKNLAFAYVDKNREKMHMAIKWLILIFFSALAVGAVLLTDPGPLDFVIMGTLIFSYFGEWAKSIHLLRIGLAVYNTALLLNAIVFFNIAGIILCAITYVGILLFYIRRWRKKDEEDDIEIKESREEIKEKE